jgi:coenzyme F420-dependent glucose-6-phosphate dehydrogenase
MEWNPQMNGDSPLIEESHRVVRIGYHASHEQFAPSELLEFVQAADQAGFSGATCSDHFLPWTDAQGESGFAWSWLGAALQATSLPMGTVTAPGDRYHPAIIAQAAATLGEMFPGRFWFAAGSGEALNEHITGAPWPPKPERNARLRECVDVMRALWNGETVTHRGLVNVVDARLYTRPPAPIPVFIAAVTPATAEWGAAWADGLLTVSQPEETLRAVIEAFQRGGGEGKPMILQAKVAYDRDDATALRRAHEQWRANIFSSDVLATLAMPSQFAAAAEFVTPDDVAQRVNISADASRHAAWLADYAGLGFDAIYVHNVGTAQQEFIEAYAEHVLPQLLGSGERSSARVAG